ncbi:Gfo/Idh/MocA family oxidoreductase [Oceaniserpentilla sp. 4NH20-0058]|uniref:Gfo/Idh/MocA family protein n=1 Tax=Oceaniserpentilla sp. 4NH20-0058 TaxID=3127660 RepID=UPI00310C759D
MEYCFAVIGLGSIAKRHRSNLKKLYPRSKVFAISSSGRVPQEVVIDADIICDSFDDLIQASPNMVIVASPAPFHLEHVKKLLMKNIPLIIEKPITSKVEDALELQELVNNAGVSVIVGYCLRYLSSAIKIKQLIDENVLGTVHSCIANVGQYLPDWRPQIDYRVSVSAREELGGGVLLELSHEFDYIQWLLGDLSFESGILQTSPALNTSVEVVADLILRTSQDVACSLHLDFLQREPHRVCSFIGEKGRLDWDLIANSIELRDSDGIQVLFNEPDWDKNLMYCNMVQDFMNEAGKKKVSGTTLSEAVKTLELINTIKQRATWIDKK